MRCDVVYLENALREHADFLNLIHFGKSTKPVKKRKPTAAAFLAFARRHNATVRRG